MHFSNILSESALLVKYLISSRSQHHVGNKLYLVRFDECILNILFLQVFGFLLCFFFVNGPEEFYVNPGCLKCISGTNLSPANKNLLIVSFIFYLALTC